MNKDPGIPPRPWKVWTVATYDTDCWGILDANGNEVVVTDCGYYPPNMETAEFICKCVNKVEARQEILEKALSVLDDEAWNFAARLRKELDELNERKEPEPWLETKQK